MLVLWLLFSIPANPADTVVGGTFRTREACEEVQVSQFLAGANYQCRRVAVGGWIGPRD